MEDVEYGGVTDQDLPLAARRWPSRTVPAAGARLLVRDVPGAAADLPPALFIHGLGGSSGNWTELGLRLSDVVRGLAPDLPGFGFTPPAGQARLDRQTTVLAALLDQEVDQPAHVFGNSMGGAIAVALAAGRPDLVRSLTLISPALPHPRISTTALWFAALATPRLGPAVLERSRRLSFERRVQVGMAMVFGDPKSLPAEVRAAYEEELQNREQQPWVPQATLEAARSIVQSTMARPRRSLWADAARVQCPVLLVYGGRDRLVDSRIRTKAQRAFPDARLLYLPRSGHVAQMEHPDLVERAFRQQLA